MALKLRARRQALGMSQEAAAERLDVDKDTISRWERGRTRPVGKATLDLLKVVYGVTQAELNDWFGDWSTRKLVNDDKYFLHGREFLDANGMDEEELLQQLIELDATMIPNLATIDEGTISQWAPIFEASPLGWKLLTHDGAIVGYWHYVCLQEEFFEKIKAGELRDSELTLSMLEFPCYLDENKTYRMYIIMMGVHNSHQYFTSGGKLVHSFIREIEKAATNGLYFSEFLTVAHTPQGVSICRSFGLDSIGTLASSSHGSEGFIFYGIGSQLAGLDRFKKYPALSRLYRERFRSG